MVHLCNCCRSFWKDFREFALEGKVISVAIAFILGNAFTSVTQSLVEDIITPPFGLLLGGVDFVNLTIKLPNFIYTDEPPVVIRYGKFLEQIIYLILMALVLFFLIRSISKLHEIATKRKLEEGLMAENKISDEVQILREIRDILSKPRIVLEEVAF